jgi:hypothetical protein
MLQVLPPVIATMVILACRAAGERRRGMGLLRVLAALSVLVSVAGFSGLRSAAGSDLGDWRRNGLGNLRRLEAGWESAGNSVIKRLTAEVRSRTTNRDPILVLPVSAAQIYYFSDRRVSGILVSYAAGVYNQPRWRELDVTRIRRAAPALVIARIELVPLGVDADIRESQREILALLQGEYSPCYEDSGWMIFCRKS